MRMMGTMVCRLCGQYSEDADVTCPASGADPQEHVWTPERPTCAWCGEPVVWGIEPYAWVDSDGYVRCADARHMHQGQETGILLTD